MVRREGDRPARRTGDDSRNRLSRARDGKDERRKRAGHRRSADKRDDDDYVYDSSPHERSRNRDSHNRDHARPKRTATSAPPPATPDRSSQASSHLLSEDSLARLNAANEKTTFVEKETVRKASGNAAGQKGATTTRKHHQHDKRKRRAVSGPLLEEGRERRYERDDASHERRSKTRRKRLWIGIIVVALLLIILVPVGVLVIGKNNGGGESGAAGGDGSAPSNENLEDISESDIPATAKGTILDPFAWYDTTDFNVTYTDQKVGDLPVMGLNSEWDDHTRPNDKVPYLDEEWEYGTRPIRGVNIGGWLNLEPFITPSLFSGYARHLEIVDEYSLTKHLGPANAAQVMERHYASFVTEKTFADIAAAGLDHVRIPFGYWAVVTYPDDPYVPQISWRYLLRGIEWARKHGLRVNLDLHGAPGSQNGWNHSGRLGLVGWLNGTDGALNGQRTLEIHDRLSKFFAQPRYKNIVSIYGLLNEPKMTKLPVQDVHRWNEQAISRVRANGITAKIVIGDGFLGLTNWKGQLTSQAANGEVILDVHQYLIFNSDQLAFTHQKKLEFVCTGWMGQMEASVDPSTGFGPTICGEFSQADTDCAEHLNNVNVGARWTGNFNTGDPSTAVLSPVCPAASSGGCSCDKANAPPSQYSDAYKKYLMALAVAQMEAFEKGGWGWFYWTWDTEETVQWSWKKGREAGTLPQDPAVRDSVCGDDVGKWVDPSLGEEY